MRITYIVCIILVGVWYGFQIFAFIFNCKPVSGFWDKTVESTCKVSTAKANYSSVFIYVNAGGTLLVDIIVLLLPIPAIWNLELHRHQKWAIFGIFAVGGMWVHLYPLKVSRYHTDLCFLQSPSNHSRSHIKSEQYLLNCLCGLWNMVASWIMCRNHHGCTSNYPFAY